MTREERNIKLKHLITCMKCEVSGKVCDDNCPTQYEAGNMGEIIENLEAISKMLEQEPCEDAISRDELLKAIDTWDKFGCDADTKLVPYQDHYIPYIHYDDVVKCVKGIPSVTPKPKTGHWIDKFGGEYRCSCCREIISIDTEIEHPNGITYKYCPNCGCRIEGSE